MIPLAMCLLYSLPLTAALDDLPAVTSDAVASREITLHPGGNVIVRERRIVELPSPRCELHCVNVPTRVNPDSLWLRSLTPGSALHAEVQEFRYDVSTTHKLLTRYQGEEVIATLPGGRTIRGRLALMRDGMILQTANGIQLLSFTQAALLSLPKMPEDQTLSLTRPSIVFQVSSARAGKHEIEIGYTAREVNWSVEYTGWIAPDSSTLDLSGVIALDNRTGMRLEAARGAVVSGPELPPLQNPPLQETESPEVPAKFPSIVESMIRVPLPLPVTLEHYQEKRLSFFEAGGLKTSTVLEFNASERRRHPRILLQFVSPRQLPPGRLRLYQRSTIDDLVLIGDQVIGAQESGALSRVPLGTESGIEVNREVIGFRLVKPGVNEVVVKTTVQNNLLRSTSVRIVEQFAELPQWSIHSSTRTYTRLDEKTVVFSLSAPGRSKASVTVRVRMQESKAAQKRPTTRPGVPAKSAGH